MITEIRKLKPFFTSVIIAILLKVICPFSGLIVSKQYPFAEIISKDDNTFTW